MFLRLLLKVQKKDGLPNLFFFFFFFQEKQATENGILQIYKHGENCQNALRMAWLCEDPHRAPPAAGSVSLPNEMFGFLLSHLLRPLRGLPIPDRPVHKDPAATPLSLPERTAVRGAILHRARWQWGCFLWQCSVACSSNKLVAIKADAVFS